MDSFFKFKITVESVTEDACTKYLDKLKNTVSDLQERKRQESPSAEHDFDWEIGLYNSYINDETSRPRNNDNMLMTVVGSVEFPNSCVADCNIEHIGPMTLPESVVRRIILGHDSIPSKIALDLSHVSVGANQAVLLWGNVYNGDVDFFPGNFFPSMSSDESFVQLESVIKSVESIIDRAYAELTTKGEKRPKEKYSEHFEKMKSNGLVEHEYSLVTCDVSKCHYKIKGSITLRHNIWGALCGALPIPERGENGAKFSKNAIVVAETKIEKSGDDYITSRATSTAMQNNLMAISNVANSSAQGKVVCLQGAPGTGKEVMAQLIHTLSLNPRKNKPVIISLAGLAPDEIKKRLFGQVFNGHWVQGLIEDAKGGTLFLDECEKVGNSAQEAKSFYTSLLRVLESKEYLPENGSENKKVICVNWIFAGAFTMKDRRVSDVFPPDMDSRFTDKIVLENPLMAKNTVNFDYFNSLFIYFYLKLVEYHFSAKLESLYSNKDFKSRLAKSLLPIHDGDSYNICNEFLELLIKIKSSMTLEYAEITNFSPRDVRQLAIIVFDEAHKRCLPTLCRPFQDMKNDDAFSGRLSQYISRFIKTRGETAAS